MTILHIAYLKYHKKYVTKLMLPMAYLETKIKISVNNATFLLKQPL